MPNYDLGLLITLNIGLTLTGILAAMIGVWVIVRQNIYISANTERISASTERISASTERVAEIAQHIDARIRRQFPDIDNDL
jgi:methyl-accepting chemotaxis protein